MPTFERSVIVRAPRTWLFDVMQDYRRRLEWGEFFADALLVDAGEAAVGARAWCVDTAGRGMETSTSRFVGRTGSRCG